MLFFASLEAVQNILECSLTVRSLSTAAWTTGGCSEHGVPSRSPSSRHMGAGTVTDEASDMNLTHSSTGPSPGVYTSDDRCHAMVPRVILCEMMVR